MNLQQIPDAKVKPSGNPKLPPCELCKVRGVSIPAHFIIDAQAVCYMHWREIHGSAR